MLIFLSALIFLTALIILIVYSVKLHRARKKYLGKEALQKLAEKSVQEAKAHDRFITCDYCGAKIDTALNKVCPQCGGAFGGDEEWENRHAVNREKAIRQTEKQYKKNKRQAAEESGLAQKKIRNIAILSLLVFITAAAAALSVVLAEKELSLASDKLPSGYSKCDYSFNNALLLDDAGINVALGDVFEKNYGEDSKSYAVELIAKNNTDKTVRITAHVGEINRKVYNILLSGSSVVSGGNPVIRYLIFKNTSEPELKEIGFVDLLAEKETGIPFAGTDRGFTVRSDAVYEPEKPGLKGEILYENPDCVISLEQKTKLYDNILYIENTGSRIFTINPSGVLDGKDTYIYLHDTVLPGTVGEYKLSDIFPSNSLLKADKVQIRLHGQDIFADDIFDTGYLSLN